MLCPTEEMSRGVGRAMSSRASRTATMIAAAMTMVDANFALMRACSSPCLRPCHVAHEQQYRRRKGESTNAFCGSLPGSLPDESRHEIARPVPHLGEASLELPRECRIHLVSQIVVLPLQPCRGAVCGSRP